MFFLNILIITVSELTKEFGYRQNETTVKWLNQNNIETHKMGRDLAVYRWQIDLKLNELSVEKLQRIYPTKWMDIYKKLQTDSEMIEAISTIYSYQERNNSIPQFVKSRKK